MQSSHLKEYFGFSCNFYFLYRDDNLKVTHGCYFFILMKSAPLEVQQELS